MLFSTAALYPKANRANLPEREQDSYSESIASLRREMLMMGFSLCVEQYVANGFSPSPRLQVVIFLYIFIGYTFSYLDLSSHCT